MFVLTLSKINLDTATAMTYALVNRQSSRQKKGSGAWEESKQNGIESCMSITWKRATLSMQHII